MTYDKLLEPCIKITVITEIRSKFKMELVHQEMYIREIDLEDYIKRDILVYDKSELIHVEYRVLNECYNYKRRLT